jgi:hypothetical protein
MRRSSAACDPTGGTNGEGDGHCQPRGLARSQGLVGLASGPQDFCVCGTPTAARRLPRASQGDTYRRRQSNPNPLRETCPLHGKARRYLARIERSVRGSAQGRWDNVGAASYATACSVKVERA